MAAGRSSKERRRAGLLTQRQKIFFRRETITLVCDPSQIRVLGFLTSVKEEIDPSWIRRKNIARLIAISSHSALVHSKMERFCKLHPDKRRLDSLRIGSIYEASGLSR